MSEAGWERWARRVGLSPAMVPALLGMGVLLLSSGSYLWEVQARGAEAQARVQAVEAEIAEMEVERAALRERLLQVQAETSRALVVVAGCGAR